jgi:hypothetical protein
MDQSRRSDENVSESSDEKERERSDENGLSGENGHGECHVHGPDEKEEEEDDKAEEETRVESEQSDEDKSEGELQRSGPMETEDGMRATETPDGEDSLTGEPSNSIVGPPHSGEGESVTHEGGREAEATAIPLSPDQAIHMRLVRGQVLTVSNRDWLPRGRGPLDDSVWKSAGADGVAIACTPEFWKALGCANNLEDQVGARLKLLVRLANGSTFHRLRFPKVAGLAHSCDARLTWHVVPSMHALMAQAKAMSVQDLDNVLNMKRKHSRLRTEENLKTCPMCATPLVEEDDVALVRMYRCARGGQCAHGPAAPAAHTPAAQPTPPQSAPLPTALLPLPPPLLPPPPVAEIPSAIPADSTNNGPAVDLTMDAVATARELARLGVHTPTAGPSSSGASPSR